jgi:adenylyltransferase/sulfurtransferase
MSGTSIPAAAGVGKIAIADFDLVDEANLQRQVLYGSDDLGKLKSIIAAKRLNR